MSELLLPPAVRALFPGVEERRRIDAWLTDELAAILPRIQSGLVAPRLDMTLFDEDLRSFDFMRPMPLERVLGWTMRQLEHGIVHMSNPRYFGLFNPGANFPAQCAERIGNLFNPQLASSASSPVPVAMEAHTIKTMGLRAGLGEAATGHFATGGSEANYTSVICALTRAHPDFGTHGARALPGAPTFYTSSECHMAWSKIAHQAGIGRAALRLIGTDGQGRMDAEVLRRCIATDRAAGHVPVMVVATAGTTGGGMIDPLHACADIAHDENMWFHVDAAWGGAALVSERMRPLLAGIERSDSITIDAHKWLATTMGCAMFLTRHGPVLSEAFRATTNFMPSNAAQLDPYLNSVQWSRRFIGLRLFVALASAGWEGLSAHVERSVAVINHTREQLETAGWTVANDSPLAVLNVIPPTGCGDLRSLVRKVVREGNAWVAFTTFEGRDVVRICATNGESTLGDVQKLVAELERAIITS